MLKRLLVWSVLLLSVIAIAGCLPPELVLAPASAQLPCDGEGVLLTLETVIILPTPPASTGELVQQEPSEMRWYRDGDVVAVTEPLDVDTLLVTSPGIYWAELWAWAQEPAGARAAGQVSEALPADMRRVAESNRVTVTGCESAPPCTRSDVSVIIYGGWNGIPVDAWVGGTLQKQLLSELDARGQPAVLWTFYPPVGHTWSVTVAPQMASGLDPDRWQYRLLRIELPGGTTVTSHPAAASAQISACSGRTFVFQLVDTAVPSAAP
jgi:hypothetical protein